MKIAVTGAHFTGKTALIAELIKHLPDYHLLPEPYYQLAEEGYAFHAVPTREDFETQLIRARDTLRESEPDTLFDRCPLDFLAYLGCQRDSSDFVLEDTLPDVLTALKTLDLIVYLPIEDPDRIRLPASEDADFRAAVDDGLRALLFEESDNLTTAILEVQGTLNSRVEQILSWIKARSFKIDMLD